MSEEMMGGNKKAIKMFDGPGQGKKQCPKCKVYIGVRNKSCVCGYEWEKTVASAPVLIASRSSFGGSSVAIKKRKKDYSLPQEPKVVINSVCGVLYTPGGPSLEAGLKIKFQAAPDDYQAISEWAGAMLDMGQSRGFNYGPQSLRYFLRYYFDINSPEYKVAVGTLNQWSAEYFAPSETPIVQRD